MLKTTHTKNILNSSTLGFKQEAQGACNAHLVLTN